MISILSMKPNSKSTQSTAKTSSKIYFRRKILTLNQPIVFINIMLTKYLRLIRLILMHLTWVWDIVEIYILKSQQLEMWFANKQHKERLKFHEGADTLIFVHRECCTCSGMLVFKFGDVSVCNVHIVSVPNATEVCNFHAAFSQELHQCITNGIVLTFTFIHNRRKCVWQAKSCQPRLMLDEPDPANGSPQ